MSAPLQIKVCGMRHPANIKEVAALGVDYIGIIQHPRSPRYVPEEEADAVRGAVPPQVRAVCVTVNLTVEENLRLLRLFGARTVQLHGAEPPQVCAAIAAHGIEVWKAAGIAGAADFEALAEYAPVVDRFVFDRKSASHGGTGEKFPWEALAHYRLDVDFMLGGGVSAADAGQILRLRHPRLVGVDLNSRFETEPARKDAALIREFISNINPYKIQQ